jgi:putative transposase
MAILTDSQADAGTPGAEICRRLGVSEAAFYRQRKVYAGMGVSEIRRLKQLEDENTKLKCLVADLTLGETMLQDALRKAVKPVRRLEVVEHFQQAYVLSERRACDVSESGRASHRYKSWRGPQTPLRMRVKELAETHARRRIRSPHYADDTHAD